MDVTYMMGLLGGLALFLYGMQMMSSGLEAAAGNKIKLILEKYRERSRNQSRLNRDYQEHCAVDIRAVKRQCKQVERT